MSQTVLRSGIDWDHLPVGRVINWVDRDAMLARLTTMRVEWTEATGGPLDQVTLDLSSLFADFEAIIKGERP